MAQKPPFTLDNQIKVNVDILRFINIATIVVLIGSLKYSISYSSITVLIDAGQNESRAPGGCSRRYSTNQFEKMERHKTITLPHRLQCDRRNAKTYRLSISL